MNNLVNIREENGRQVVSARELHGFFQINSNFTTWCKRMFSYGFEENMDYIPFLENRSDGLPGKQKQDFALTLDCAKEISMLQRNEKGKQARKYFIQVEKEYKKSTQLSPAEQLLHNAQLLVAQERKLNEVEGRLDIVESKLLTKPDMFTIAGYANLNDLKINVRIASRLGRSATKICKDEQLLTDSIPDPRFGKVKLYPTHVLERVFTEVTL